MARPAQSTRRGKEPGDVHRTSPSGRLRVASRNSSNPAPANALDCEPVAGPDADACRHWLASFGRHLEWACLAPPLQRTGRHGAGLREVEIVRVADEAARVLHL